MANRFSTIIEQTEKRFDERKAFREERRTNIDKLLKREDGDWRLIDEPERVMNRLINLGKSDLVADAMAITAPTRDKAQPEETPFFDALERIIEKNELMSTSFLRGGAAAARSVGRIVFRSASGRVTGYGTGFMVSPRLMMTNNHVLPSSGEAAFAVVQFNVFNTLDGRSRQAMEFRFDPTTFYETSQELDFTLVAVHPSHPEGYTLESLGWNPLIEPSGKVIVGERVNIIQHPNGEPQQLSLRQNQISDISEDFVHYSTDTRQGSSGSPVFNDQWEVAALHHSGVPMRNGNDQIMLLSGIPWDGSDATIDQIHWIANEGVRISKIVARLKERTNSMPAEQLRLFEEAFLPCEANVYWPDPIPGRLPESRAFAATAPGPSSGQPQIDEHGYMHWTVPLEIRVGLSAAAMPSVSPLSHNGSQPRRNHATSQGDLPAGDNNTLRDARRRLDDAARRPYYDENRDRQESDAYYDGLPGSKKGRALYSALHELLQSTHANVYAYKEARYNHLYPWVDLHESAGGERELRSIYSGKGVPPEKVILEELEIESLRDRKMQEFFAAESFTEEGLELFMEDLERSIPFNCEHVVPKSWYAKAKPMVTDLHHLFTCEPTCNSFRSNIPFFDFPPVQETTRSNCGRKTEDKFEPVAGKGAVARATLYFLIRYPGIVGDQSREMQSDRLPVLLNWHKSQPVSIYEKHRNAAIAEAQGNRNPLIDHPDWAEKIDFSAGFGW